MDRINVQTTDTPEIFISRIDGSLRIKGWDRPELRADSDRSDTLNIQSADNKVEVDCKSGCMIRIPIESTLQIDRVDRELMLKSIECFIDVKSVAGQVMVKSIGAINIEKASSNLTARNVEGNFECGLISGNASLQDIEGKIKLEKVSGNLVIKGFSTGIDANTSGNATLRLDPEADAEIMVNARGNISCRLSPGTNATVTLSSGSKFINLNTTGKSELIREEDHVISLGDGTGKISLVANGNIELTVPVADEVDWSYEFDLEEDVSAIAGDISQIVSEQLETQLESLSQNLNTLTSNLSYLGPFASEKSKEKLEAKRVQLERKLARIERRAASKARMASKTTAAATRRFARQKPTSDPVSDSERQKVLEMLQNKQISVQDAELLLAALEGRDPEITSSRSSSSENPVEQE